MGDLIGREQSRERTGEEKSGREQEEEMREEVRKARGECKSESYLRSRQSHKEEKRRCYRWTGRTETQKWEKGQQERRLETEGGMQ